jgi:hypothetical protein
MLEEPMAASAISDETFAAPERGDTAKANPV